ncbi:MAG: BMP family ABC transporter substrate-binding protein [Oscillospiraceae bacterium]|jgi:basic membrane protein A|nr:BMP family ABC transporter substrate-binding protein [Oscillospiraceae bacterium]
MKKAMTIKRVLALALAALLLVFGACSVGGSTPGGAEGEGGSEKAQEKTAVLSAEDSAVALLLCDAEMKSASARALWLTVEKFTKETGIDATWFMLPTQEDIKARLDDILAQGFNIVITNNGLHTDYIKERAAEFPDVSFVAMEGFFTDKGKPEQLEAYPNLIQGTVRAEESAFLAGYLLAKRSESGKIGLLNGTQNPPGFQMEAGFAAGVAFAEQETGKKIETRVEYVGNGYNRTGGRNSANVLYNSGCDMIYICAGGETDWGALEAAKALGKPCITAGHTSYIAPENVVGEVLKNKDPVVTEILDGLYYGTLKGGQVLDRGLGAGSSGFVRTGLTEEFFGAALLAQLEDVIARIESGEIKVPQGKLAV